MSGFRRTDPVRKRQAGVQESSGPLLPNASQLIRTGCESDPACLLRRSMSPSSRRPPLRRCGGYQCIVGNDQSDVCVRVPVFRSCWSRPLCLSLIARICEQAGGLLRRVDRIPLARFPPVRGFILSNERVYHYYLDSHTVHSSTRSSRKETRARAHARTHTCLSLIHI